MKIALLGYGKMGKIIEELAVADGHEIMLRISSTSKDQFTKSNMGVADVAIEFSSPNTAYDHVSKCLEWGVPVVSGSTGWESEHDSIKEQSISQNGAFLYASNFSIGVNIFRKINRQLAALMTKYPQYSASMEEIHHTQKLDAPSGTAITLAQDIMSQNSKITRWVKGDAETTLELGITSKRIEGVPGTHSISYNSEIDSIVISHIAHNRMGFAKGALLAAEWLKDKKGNFTMDDVLTF